MYRFQTDTQRNNLPVAMFELFAGVMLLLGFGLNFTGAVAFLETF